MVYDPDFAKLNQTTGTFMSNDLIIMIHTSTFKKGFDCIRIIMHWIPFLLNDVVFGIFNHFINYFQSWIHTQNIFFIFIVQTEHNNMKSPRLVV